MVARSEDLEVLVLHEVQQELPVPDGVPNLSEGLVPRIVSELPAGATGSRHGWKRF
tara:strand:+ start:980 stop:1147 length:168 start_codon:yes stop_codon:yes gene_type:complete